MSRTLSLPGAVTTLSDLQAIEGASERFDVEVDGTAMVWRRWGPQDGAPVVLLHGGSGAWNHWVRNIGALIDAGRAVWAPDLPGFGDSSRPPSGGDADSSTEPVQAAMQTLFGDASLDLVGFSFGSLVAGFIAAQFPQRARRIVLVGMPALGLKPAQPLILKAWSHLPPGEAQRAVHRENLMRLMLHDAASLDEVALTIQERNLPRDRMRLRRISRTDILKRTLANVRCPVWAILGEHDVLYRGVDEGIEQALAESVDFRGLTRIADAGHWVQYERAAAFDAALAQALNAAAHPGSRATTA